MLDGLGELDHATRKLVVEDTPLWYFVLAEANARGRGGTHLGPVGGRIVAEQLIGLLLADDASYLCAAPGWEPSGVLQPSFTAMADFVRYALAAQM